jgi:hypothetical protein
MKQDIEKTDEELVSEVLRKYYAKFYEEPYGSTVATIVTLLRDETKRSVEVGAGFESDAAYLTRMTLLEVFRHGVNSVKATTDIFNSLERGHELGWLAG